MENISDPKVDVHLTNGNVEGRFRFKFKQNWFNGVVSLILAGCSGHSLWLHYHTTDLEKDHEKAITLLATTQITLADVQMKLAESERREIMCIQALSTKGK